MQSISAVEAQAFARGWRQALATVAGLAPGVAAPLVLPPPPPLLLGGCPAAFPPLSAASAPNEVAPHSHMNVPPLRPGAASRFSSEASGSFWINMMRCLGWLSASTHGSNLQPATRRGSLHLHLCLVLVPGITCIKQIRASPKGEPAVCWRAARHAFQSSAQPPLLPAARNTVAELGRTPCDPQVPMPAAALLASLLAIAPPPQQPPMAVGSGC